MRVGRRGKEIKEENAGWSLHCPLCARDRSTPRHESSSFCLFQKLAFFLGQNGPKSIRAKFLILVRIQFLLSLRAQGCALRGVGEAEQGGVFY